MNPDNPRKVDEEVVERLAGKLKRVPEGLKAMRIAYVVKDGVRVVIAGNTRLKALRKLYGEDGECPDEWFQDVSYMDEEQRRQFIVSSNVNEGEWDLDKLLAQYDVSYLNDLGMEDVTSMLPSDLRLEDVY